MGISIGVAGWSEPIFLRTWRGWTPGWRIDSGRLVGDRTAGEPGNRAGFFEENAKVPDVNRPVAAGRAKWLVF